MVGYNIVNMTIGRKMCYVSISKVNMKLDKDSITKDFYTTQELVDVSWFPVKSTLTIKKLIESGKLEAVDISTSSRFKRYRISKQSVTDFLEQQTNVLEKKKKRK